MNLRPQSATNERPETDQKKISIVIAASGGGRSLLNFIENHPHIKVAGVIVSKVDCGAHKIAAQHNLPTMQYTGGQELLNKEKLSQWLQIQKPDLICLAGYLKLFPILKEWQNKILNIHPSLLPKFGGKGMYGSRVHRKVIEQQEPQSGASVHVVTDEYDKGPIIAQSHVPVLADDNVSTLANRVFESECRLYPWALKCYQKNGFSVPDQPFVLPETNKKKVPHAD